jgi:hypothetical protein
VLGGRDPGVTYKLWALATKRDDAWRAHDRVGRDFDTKKKALPHDVARHIEQATKETELFAIRWIVE